MKDLLAPIILFLAVFSGNAMAEQWSYDHVDASNPNRNRMITYSSTKITPTTSTLTLTGRDGLTVTIDSEDPVGIPDIGNASLRHSEHIRMHELGDTWSASYSYQGDTQMIKIRINYSVEPGKRVESPAGSFDTVKIVGNGTWTSASGYSGPFSTSCWYATAVNNCVVHTQRSTRNDGRVNNDITTTLISYEP